MTSTNLLSVPAPTAATLVTSTLPSSVLVPSTSPTGIPSIVSDTGTPVIPATASSPVNTALRTSSLPSLSSNSSPAFVAQPAAQNTSGLPAVAAVPNQQAKLTTGEIVGIAVAGGAAACFALGVLVFIFCLRQRRRQRRRSARLSMAMEKRPPPPRPSTPGQDSGQARTTFPDPADLAIDHGQRYYATPPVEEKRRSFWRRSIKPEDIGVAVSPDTVHDSSPASFSSQRTASQLLPALPNYGLWPEPLRLSRQIPTSTGLVRPESTATVFEEDVGVTVPNQPSNIESRQEMPERVGPSQLDSRLPSDPRAQTCELEGATAAATQFHIPLTPVYDNGVNTPVYDKAQTHELEGATAAATQSHIPLTPVYDNGVHTPVYDKAQTYELEGATAAATQSHIPLTPVYDNGVNTPVYDKAPSTSVITGPSQAFIPTLPQRSSSTFAQDPRRASPPQAHVTHQRSLQTYSSAPNLPRNQQQQHHHPRASASTPSFSATTGYTDKRSNTARKGSIDSAGSDITAFETDDDATPEQELDKRPKPSMLSPVMESPVRHQAAFDEPASPIKDLRYPRIPRPAALTRQAERAPKPRAPLQINTTAMRRDQLVLEERSFLQSQSTSQPSPEPNPSLLAKRRGDRASGEMQGGLKLSSDSANRAAPISKNLQVLHSEEQPLRSPGKPKLVLDTRGTGVENENVSKRNSVGLTPTRRGGDLFLTVDRSASPSNADMV